MTKASKHSDSYKSVGTTYDFVRILEPKMSPESGTKQQIRSTLDKIMGERAAPAVEGSREPSAVFVERRPQGDYAVRRSGSDRASAVLPTQAEAIARARELAPGASAGVERVRHTGAGKPEQWRKA